MGSETSLAETQNVEPIPRQVSPRPIKKLPRPRLGSPIPPKKLARPILFLKRPEIIRDQPRPIKTVPRLKFWYRLVTKFSPNSLSTGLLLTKPIPKCTKPRLFGLYRDQPRPTETN